MALFSLSDYDKTAGTGYGGNDPVTLRKILTEMQGQTRTLLAGFSGGVSASISLLSAGGGDTLLSVVVHSSGVAAVDITGSSSFSNDRIVVADTDTSGKVLDVMWYNKDNA